MTSQCSFEDFELKISLLKSIYSYGFEYASKIQAKAIGPMIEGKELIAQSHSGTGKTGAFTIGALQIIDDSISDCQAIILTPTHELANQVYTVAKALSRYTNVKISLCVGKTSIPDNIKSLKGAQLIIGTPGRITDMLNRKYIDKSTIKLLILDEADEMLSGDFKIQIETIIRTIPKTAQICLFSATITDNTLEISKRFYDKEPIKILIDKERLTLDEISQFYVMVNNEKFKYNVFKEIYNLVNVGQAIVYTNTQSKAKWLYESLIEDNNTCGVIYSKMEAQQRSDVLRDFRNGKVRILISTDLLSRGIDIQKLSVVINYDIPSDKECYIHRIGRSGRYGKRGVAINLATYNDIRYVKDLEKFYKTTIAEMPDNIDSYL